MGMYQVRIYLGEVDSRKGPDITAEAHAVTAERALRQLLMSLQPQPTIPEWGLYAEVQHLDSVSLHLFEDYQVPPDPNVILANPEQYTLGTSERHAFGELRYAQALFPSDSSSSDQEARNVDRAIQVCVDVYYNVPLNTRPFAIWDPLPCDTSPDEACYRALVDLPEEHPDRAHGMSWLVDALEVEIHKNAQGHYSLVREEGSAEATLRRQRREGNR